MKRVCSGCGMCIRDKNAFYCPNCGACLQENDRAEKKLSHCQTADKAKETAILDCFCVHMPKERQIDGKQLYQDLQDSHSKKQLYSGISAWLSRIQEQNTVDLPAYRKEQSKTVKFDFEAVENQLRETAGNSVPRSDASLGGTGLPIPKGKTELNFVSVPDSLLKRLSETTESLFDRFRSLVDAESLYAAFCHDSEYGNTDSDPLTFLQCLLVCLVDLSESANPQEKEEQSCPDNRKAEELLKDACERAEAVLRLPLKQDFLTGCQNIRDHIGGFWKSMFDLTFFSNLRLKVFPTVDGIPFEQYRQKWFQERYLPWLHTQSN